MSVRSEEGVKIEIDAILEDIAQSKGLKNYETKPDPTIQVGDGFVSHMYNGEVIDKDTGSVITVAIKMVPRSDFDFGSLYSNEIIFYSKTIPALNSFVRREANPELSHEIFNNIPELLSLNDNLKDPYIALEHLKPQGYVLHDKVKYLDREHLELIFRTYGKFHATSFAWRKRDFESYQRIHEEYKDLFGLFADDKAEIMFRAAMQAALDALSPDSREYEIAKDLPNNIQATVIKATKYDGNYRCSTHGDCWSNNMLFKYSDSGKLEDIRLLDFQLARDGTPIHDLSYFFYSGASKRDFDMIEDYLRIYHEAFSKTLKLFGEEAKDVFPFEVLVKEWKENAFLGILLGIYLWQVKLVPKEKVIDLLLNGQGLGSDDLIEKMLKLWGNIYKSDDFIERTGNILKHAVDYGVLTKDKVAFSTADEKDIPVSNGDGRK